MKTGTLCFEPAQTILEYKHTMQSYFALSTTVIIQAKCKSCKEEYCIALRNPKIALASLY